MGTCSNQPFTSEQKTQIQGMVNATLQGTTSPQITDYVRNYADTQAEEGIGQLQQQYSTFGPAICDSAIDKFTNSTRPPTWASDLVAQYEKGITDQVTSKISLEDIQTKCTAPSPAPACTPGDATKVGGVSCSTDNTCTLTMYDKDTILYIPSNNVVISGDLTVDQQLVASTITGDISSKGNTC